MAVLKIHAKTRAKAVITWLELFIEDIVPLSFFGYQTLALSLPPFLGLHRKLGVFSYAINFEFGLRINTDPFVIFVAR